MMVMMMMIMRTTVMMMMMMMHNYVRIGWRIKRATQTHHNHTWVVLFECLVPLCISSWTNISDYFKQGSVIAA